MFGSENLLPRLRSYACEWPSLLVTAQHDRPAPPCELCIMYVLEPTTIVLRREPSSKASSRGFIQSSGCDVNVLANAAFCLLYYVDAVQSLFLAIRYVLRVLFKAVCFPLVDCSSVRVTGQPWPSHSTSHERRCTPRDRAGSNLSPSHPVVACWPSVETQIALSLGVSFIS